jgi:hypothetical protein
VTRFGSLFGARDAAGFARLVDAGGAAAAAPGLSLVAQLRTAGLALDSAVAPRPEFRDALRQRLLAVATVQGASPAVSPAVPPAARPADALRALPAAVSWRRRGSTVAAGALASVLAVSGVAVAGSQSLPGDPFYGVKRTTEALQLRLADGEVEKGTRHLDFAATRLREVRGLTLGRDAADAGPVLGPSAMTGAITLRSAEQPLAAGAALSAGIADRVRRTLTDMDEQTREGTELLTGAYRSSQATEPLRALSRFATRQSAGLEQLLPALPPATQSQARSSLALLTEVSESTDELIRIGTCGQSCDPDTAAPVVPGQPGEPAPTATGSAAECECPQPAPAPDPRSTVTPAPAPAPSTAEPEPEPTRSASPRPSPTPTPSPSPSGHPLPLPSLPVPVPTLPVPVPTITLSPLLEPVAVAVESVLPGLSGKAASSGGAPPPAPAATPVPQLAPLPPRP